MVEEKDDTSLYSFQSSLKNEKKNNRRCLWINIFVKESSSATSLTTSIAYHDYIIEYIQVSHVFSISNNPCMNYHLKIRLTSNIKI